MSPSSPDAERLPLLLVVGPVPPPPHGTSVYVRMLLESRVVAAAWRVEHLDTSDRRSLENLGRVDLGNVRLGITHLFQLAVRLVRDRPRVVWIPLSQNGPGYLRDGLFIALSRLTGARVVGHLHGGWFHEFHRAASAPMRWLIRSTCRMLSGGWVLGEGLKTCFAGLIPPERVRVIPNGVPDPAVAPRPADYDRAFTVLYLGQLSNIKGVDDLLVAFEGVADPRARLILAGDWLTRRDEERIKGKIASSPAGGRIQLVGPVDARAKSHWLGQADVFVLPARSHEGQPLVILEAMAAGLPVITTRRGAIPDMVQHEVTGLLVPEADPVALTAALDRLAGDPDLRARLGRAGRERWSRDFTEERAMGRVAEALEEFKRHSVRSPSHGYVTSPP